MFSRKDVKTAKRSKSGGLTTINLDFGIRGLIVSCDNMSTNKERWVINIMMFDPKLEQIGFASKRLSSNSQDIQSIIDKEVVAFGIHSVNNFLIENRDRVFRLIFE